MKIGSYQRKDGVLYEILQRNKTPRARSGYTGQKGKMNGLLVLDKELNTVIVTTRNEDEYILTELLERIPVKKINRHKTRKAFYDDIKAYLNDTYIESEGTND